jgi:hypothetical protein
VPSEVQSLRKDIDCGDSCPDVLDPVMLEI